MRKHCICFAVALGALLLVSVSGQKVVDVKTPDRAMPLTVGRTLPDRPAAKLRTTDDFGRMPLSFIANQGQLDNRVAFSILGADKSLYFTASGVTYVLSRPVYAEKEASAAPAAGAKRKPITGAESWTIQLDFAGANPDVRPVGREKADSVVSYFRGSRDHWSSGVPTYASILYRSLWPGVDLAYSGTTRRLKYDFTVEPGGDPGRIRLAYRGASDVKLNETGELEVKTPLGDFRDAAPEAYQEIGGRRVSVPVRYVLDPVDPESGAPTYGFKLGAYDPTRPLVIDPAVLVYCGYIGGSLWDYGFGIAADANSAAYVTGYTYSPGLNFPVTVGPDTSPNGDYDAFIAKVNSQGTGLIYCGYIGGSAFDWGVGVAADVNGNAYVVGQTQSTQTNGFPVTVGPDLTYGGGGWDVFVAKVNPSGTGLVYCGYVGGTGDDFPAGGGQSGAIAVDAGGNAYIAGETSSTQLSFPVTVGPDLTYNGGSNDDFVAKINAAGTGFVYCGYLGGSDFETCTGIALDGSGCAYLVGFAFDDAAFPLVVGPNLTHNPGLDTYIAKLNPAGTAWLYCGWLGGSGDDRGWSVAVDGTGAAYVTGYTTSPDLPVSGGLDGTFNGYEDTFVAKVAASGTGLAYCGYIGGTGDDTAYHIAVDGAGCAYVTGYTTSSEAQGFPVTVGPDLTFNSGTDAFVAKVNPAGAALVYCGYIGGASGETARGIAVDKCANALITGDTASISATFPVTVGPDLTQNGNDDAFVAKVSSVISGRNLIAADLDGDGQAELVGDFDYLGVWYWNSGAWLQLSGANVENLLAADTDGDGTAEIVGDFGQTGLWLWNANFWTQLSGVNCDAIAAANVDGDTDDEIVGDFGPVGLWLWNSGAWTQLSGVNVEQTVALHQAGGDKIVGDFGAVGLWVWSAGAWTQLSGVNAEDVMAANIDGAGGDEIVVDFGPVGLWLWQGSWSQVSGLSPEQMIALNVDGAGGQEIVGDFGAVGLWLWSGGNWSQISNQNLGLMIAANIDGGADREIVAGFGALGIWAYVKGAWSQLSGSPAEYLVAADVDGSGLDEIAADLNYLGLWLRTGTAWTQLR